MTDDLTRDCDYVTYFPINIRPMSGTDLEARHTDGSAGFGAYFHIPLCDKICPFCNYNKFPAESHADAIVEGIKREIEAYGIIVSSEVKHLDFVYFGGGTPSVLTPSHIKSLLDLLARRFNLAGCEICVECHPTHATLDYLTELRGAGVNRISFGVQSYQDRLLRLIGSYHDSAQGRECVSNARAAGFDNVAIDLMFLLPGQTIEDWISDLQIAFELDPDHVSLYRMLLDPAAPLGRGIRYGRTQAQGDETFELELAASGLEVMSNAGYAHYGSCSSGGFDLCKPGRESVYEMFHRAAPQSEYIALGPGAVGHVNGYVYWNVHTIREYLDVVRGGGLPVLAGRRLTESDRRSRYCVLGIKHLNLPLAPFEDRFGSSIGSTFPDSIDWLARHGLAEMTDSALVVSRRGVHYMDNISKAFFNPENVRLPQPYKPELQLMSVELFGTR